MAKYCDVETGKPVWCGFDRYAPKCSHPMPCPIHKEHEQGKEEKKGDIN